MADKNINLLINAILNDKQFTKQIKKYAQKVSDAEKKTKGFRKTLEGMFGKKTVDKVDGIIKGFVKFRGAILAGVAAVAGITLAFKKAIDKASEFEEANSKFEVVFRGNIALANKFRDELVSSFGLSKLAATKQ
jgi:hypothetical protein